MPKQIPDQELDAILAVVAAHPEGVRVSTIRDGLPDALPPRMLQRRLALLIDQQRLIAEGRGKGRRYRVPVNISGTGNLTLPSVQVAGQAEVYIPVSPEGERIKQAVRAPIQNRQPIGYQHDFLDDYRPNVTYYLPAETRRRLLDSSRL